MNRPFRVVMVQDKSTQTDTNEPIVKPAIESIPNDPTCSIINNVFVPKAPVVIPHTKNEEFVLLQIKKLQNRYCYSSMDNINHISIIRY